MKNRFIYGAMFFYAILVHAFLVIALLKTDILARAALSVGVALESYEITEHYKRMLVYHEREDKSAKKGAVLFFGDSITQGLATSAVAPYSENFGIGQDTTYGLLNRIGKYTSIKNASAIFIEIGVNDIQYRGNDEIADNYRRILNKLPAGTHVCVSSILPVDERIGNKIPSSSRIFEINKLIKNAASSIGGVRYFDSSDRMVDESGNLRADFHVGDGVHLNQSGYGVWIEDMKKCLNEVNTM